jgi:hypothetical protein
VSGNVILSEANVILSEANVILSEAKDLVHLVGATPPESYHNVILSEAKDLVTILHSSLASRDCLTRSKPPSLRATSPLCASPAR